MPIEVMSYAVAVAGIPEIIGLDVEAVSTPVLDHFMPSLLHNGSRRATVTRVPRH
jgi:hypothetical protein